MSMIELAAATKLDKAVISVRAGELVKEGLIDSPRRGKFRTSLDRI
jgi:hypothetical protein